MSVTGCSEDEAERADATSVGASGSLTTTGLTTAASTGDAGTDGATDGATAGGSGSASTGSSGSGSATAGGSTTATTDGSGTDASTSSGSATTSAASTGTTAASTTDDPSGATTSDGSSATGSTSGAGTTDPGTTGSGTTDPGSTGSTTDASATAASATTGGPPCQVQQPTVQFTPPKLLLVLDKSGSMMSTLNGVTRWATLHDVVTALATNYQGRIEFGAKLFPTLDPDCSNPANCQGGEQCFVAAGVEIPVNPNFLQSLQAGDIPPRDQTISQYAITPILNGMNAARDWIVANLPGEEKAVVLVADGGISTFCPGHTADAVVAVIDDLASRGIPTYVIGISIFGDAQAVADMNRYAVAGGRPAPGNVYYEGNNQAQLTQAFNAIAGSVVTCAFDVSDPPPFPELTEVEVGGTRYPYDPALDCATDDGWRYVTDAMGVITGIELCGAACDGFKAALAADVEYFCTAG